MHSVCCCSLPVWRRSFPRDLFLPRPRSAPGRISSSGWKTTTLVRDLEYFIHTKFHQNLSSSSGEEVKNVIVWWTDDRRRTLRMITIGHWSLWLLCHKKNEIVVFRNVRIVKDYECWVYNGVEIDVLYELCYLGIALNYNGKLHVSQKQLAHRLNVEKLCLLCVLFDTCIRSKHYVIWLWSMGFTCRKWCRKCSSSLLSFVLGVKQESQGALIAHLSMLSTISTSIIS